MRVLLIQPYGVRRYPGAFRMSLDRMAWAQLERLCPAAAAVSRVPPQNRAPHWIDWFAAHLPREVTITSEFNHYGDLPKVLEEGRVTALDRFHPAYFEDRPVGYPGVAWEKYPSNFGFPRPNFVPLDQASAVLKNFDVVLASIKMGNDARPLLRRAKAAGLLVALFDNIDHEAAYTDPKADLFRGFDAGEFDVFFKKDIPLDNADAGLIPICPVPTKSTPPERQIPWGSRGNDLFFVGAYRPGTTRRDRQDLCDLLGDAFSGAKFLINRPPISLEAHDEEVRGTRIPVSPSGRVWCSFRHTDYGRFGSPVVLPRPNCKTAGPPFVDMENAILYETRLQDGEHRLVDPDTLIDKIRLVLSTPSRADSIGNAYRAMVELGHTTQSRAKYIADQLQQRLAA